MNDMTQLWPELGTALTSLADGADLLLADPSELGLAANVASRLIPVGATSQPLLYEPGTNWNSAHTN